MSIVGSFIARFNNSKKNLSNPNKKNKISNSKIDVIINNIVKIRENDDPDFWNDKGDPKCGNKRGKRSYNRKNNNKNKKIRVAKPDKYHKKKFKPWFLQLLMWF